MIFSLFKRTQQLISKSNNITNKIQYFCSNHEDKTSSVLENKDAHFQERNFVDKFRMTVQAGNGGNGLITFYRDRKITTGAPDGGDGGTGGDIIFQATDFFKDLRIFKKKSIQGNNGKNGGKIGRVGKDGKDIHISVPVGTLLYEVIGEKRVPEFNQIEMNIRKKREHYQKFLIDLDEVGKQYIVAKGGLGGYGNKRHRHVTPSQTKGKLGQTKQIYMELKSLADIGLVGFPNVGKSTYLSSVTRSLPKIANYSFTTLAPTVGKVKFIDEYEYTIADIPGIIEDSHKNKGLGFEFLRHIERTNVLAFVLDCSSDISLQDQLQILRRELLLYKPDFLEKKACVICSKSDMINEDELKENFENLQKNTEYSCFIISSKHGVGLGETIVHLRELITQAKQEKEEQEINSQDYYY